MTTARRDRDLEWLIAAADAPARWPTGRAPRWTRSNRRRTTSSCPPEPTLRGGWHYKTFREDRRRPPGLDSPVVVVDSRATVVDLDTRLLRAFVAVAEDLNFTRAARRLFIAQQALSSQMQQLEARLGARLFDRTTRRVRLTEAGERLLPHAVAALRALDDGVAELAAAHATLRVGLSGTAMVPIAGDTMRLFAERHPEVELKVSNTGLNQPAAGLHEGTVDVAFVRPPFLDVAWRTAHETDLARAFVRTALELSQRRAD